MVLTKEAEELIERFSLDSLHWEARDILVGVPEGTPINERELFWSATFYQGHGDTELAVQEYMRAVGQVFISNAFSLSMVGENAEIEVSSLHINYDRALLIRAVSVVGHADTAVLFSSLLGREIAVNRISVSLKSGDTLIVGQYSGPRLPEGTSTLPEGATITWKKVVVK
jgi:hypothetical protein